MTTPATATTAKPTALTAAAEGIAFSAIVELTKPRITRLVTITSGVGFCLAAPRQAWTVPSLLLAVFGCCIGTALSAAGANTLNQWVERDRDALMPRTVNRPIPTGRVPAPIALAVGLLCALLGITALWATTGTIPAAISLATILTYVLIYTPMKTISATSTLVGAVPGALPPLIGWTAASSTMAWSGLAEWGGWSLFLLMVVWQIPHFLAIAWMYRDDYKAGGYRMLPLGDTDGSRTASTILIWAVLLLPATLMPAWCLLNRPLWLYGAVALITGAAYIWFALGFCRSRDTSDARRVFIASVIHLPIIMVVLVVDALSALL